VKKTIVAAMIAAAGPAHAQELFRPAIQYPTDASTTGVAVGDVNGDGLADVVAGGFAVAGPKVYVFHQRADRTLNPAPFVYLPQRTVGSVSIGDVTGDGRNDIVTDGRAALEVIPQGAGGSLRPSIVYPTLSASAQLGDFNADGRLDAIGLEFSTEPTDVLGFAGVSLQNPAGSFDSAAFVPLPHGSNADLKVADIDGDGRDDVVTVNRYNEPSIGVLLQTTGGRFRAPLRLQIAPGVNGNTIAAGDVNGDGRKDLVVSYGINDAPNGHVAIFAQNASGGFDTPQVHDVPRFATAIQIADVNADRRQDVLLLHLDTVSVSLQDASGALGAPVEFAFGSNSNGHSFDGLSVADIDGDGALDLVGTQFQMNGQGAVNVAYGISRLANRPPLALADKAVTRRNVPVTVAVLANDRDPDGDALSLAAISQPEHGAARLTADRRVRYQPNRGFRGTDRFTYTIADGRGGTATATVTVIVR
jgi:hypothetical protein